MKTLLVTPRDLQELVRRVGLDELMDGMIARLTHALEVFDAASTEVPARTGFAYETPVTGLIEWMPLLEREGGAFMKIVGYHPENPDKRGLPTIVSTASLHDTATGRLVALMDATFLTALRTGAASAVASRLLARPESRVLGLVGCGAQAVTQLHALGRVFDLDEVLLHDVDPAATASLPARAGVFAPRGLRFRPAPPDEIVAATDILCVQTSVGVGEGPVLPVGEPRPWLHVNAVGSDFPGKTELPLQLLERSLVCPDTLDQALHEGESQQLPPDEVGPDLVTLARAPGRFATARRRLTVFDSTGWALEDRVAMELVLELVREHSLGADLELEFVPADPKDPYELLRTPKIADSRVS